MYDIFIKNYRFELLLEKTDQSKYIGYYFTPKNNKELKTAVDEWCDNRVKALIKYGDINSWNTTYIISMFRIFYDKVNFNKDISDWNVSNVTDMTEMFCEAKSFNQDIGGWDVSNVKNMRYMFGHATNFL